jgi:cytochrome P450
LQITANPYPLWHRLRVENPVHRSPMGFWVLTRYHDIAVVPRPAAVSRHVPGCCDVLYDVEQPARRPIRGS